MSECEGLFWLSTKYTNVHKSQNFNAVLKVISNVTMSVPF